MVDTFSDGKLPLMFVIIRLKYVTESEWRTSRCLDMCLLDQATASRSLGLTARTQKNVRRSVPYDNMHGVPYEAARRARL